MTELTRSQVLTLRYVEAYQATELDGEYKAAACELYDMGLTNYGWNGWVLTEAGRAKINELDGLAHRQTPEMRSSK